MNTINDSVNSAKEKLILSGIKIIKEDGIQRFSLRKVASDCSLSCAAPYKHFKDKQDFITQIIIYINEQWTIRQKKIICKFSGNTRQQLTEISLEYIRFLVENPQFRSIIMLNDKEISEEHQKMKSKLSEPTKELIEKYCKEVNMPPKSQLIKTFIVRSFIYGAALMFDNGELDYTEENFNLIAKSIDREFDID